MRSGSRSCFNSRLLSIGGNFIEKGGEVGALHWSLEEMRVDLGESGMVLIFRLPCEYLLKECSPVGMIFCLSVSLITRY